MPTLPDGFGLARAYDNRVAIWTDSACRQVVVGVREGGATPITTGPRIGRWHVFAEDPPGCSAREAAPQNCLLNYQAKIGGQVITVQMAGLTRHDGDPVAQSIG